MGGDASGAIVAKQTKIVGSASSILEDADAVDKSLMALGFLPAAGDGIWSRLTNNMSDASSLDRHRFPHVVDKGLDLCMFQNALSLVYLACGLLVAAFLEGYCWTRTGEGQTSRLRSTYVKAVLRQDVGYFELNVMSTSEVNYVSPMIHS